MRTSLLSPDEQRQYIKDFTKTILSQTFELIDDEARMHGKSVGDTMAMTLLSALINTLVTKSLKLEKELSDLRSFSERTPLPPDHKTYLRSEESDDDRRYNQIRDQYEKLKVNLQEAIAEGFTGGFLNFNPEAEPMEFLCEIRPFPLNIRGEG